MSLRTKYRPYIPRQCRKLRRLCRNLSRMVRERAWQLINAKVRLLRAINWECKYSRLTVNSQPIHLVLVNKLLDHLLQRLLNLGILCIDVHQRQLLTAHPAILDALLFAVVDPAKRVILGGFLESDILRCERGFGHVGGQRCGEVNYDVYHQEPAKHKKRQDISVLRAASLGSRFQPMLTFRDREAHYSTL